MKLKPRCRKTTVAKAVALAMCMMVSPMVLAQMLDKAIDADVAAQPVSTALIALSRQAGVQILMPGKELDRFSTPGLHGRMSLREALNKLLNGTRFGFHEVGNNTIGIDAPGINRKSADASTAEAGAALVADKGTLPTQAPGDDLGKIVVTGSRLRVGEDKSTSPMMVITQEDIENRGLSTAADIVASIPQNFSGTNASSTTTNPGLNSAPIGSVGVATANLFGLGANATLVLVNGHRLASSPNFKSDGTVDLSTIPAEAIERVEIVLDGASAIYGSDAVGGVINFILKKNYSGASLKARIDSAANGGNTRNLSGTFGTTWKTGSVLATAEVRHVSAVDAYKAGWTTSDLRAWGGTDWRDKSYTIPGNVVGYGSLPASYTGTENWTVADLKRANTIPFDTAAYENGTPTTNAFSSTLSLSQKFGSRVTANLDAFYTREDVHAAHGSLGGFFYVPASNPYNRIGQDVYVATRFLSTSILPLVMSNRRERLNVTGGVDIDLFKDWKLNLSSTYGTDKSDYTQNSIDDSVGNTANLFGNGTAQGDLSKYLRWQETRSQSTTRSIDGFADGTLFTTRAGPVKVGLGAQWRPEQYDQGTPLANTNNQSVFKLTSSAAFFEASVPLVGRGNRMAAAYGLLLSLAGRFDRYDFEGQFQGPSQPEEKRSFSKFSPRVGLLYNPIKSVKMRASWGKSFRAPAIMQLNTPTIVYTGTTDQTQDPLTGQVVTAHFGNSGNPTLQPETSTTQSYGIEWTPERSGLLLGITYTRYLWDGRIAIAKADDPTMWPYLGSFPFLIPRDLPTSLGGDGNPNTIDAALNAPINIAMREVQTLNPLITYDFPVKGGGLLAFQLSGVFTLKARDKILPGSPYLQNVATSQGPDRSVISGNISWSRDNYGLNLYGHYSSPYTNTYLQLRSGTSAMSTARTHVSSWTTFDLTGFYKIKGFRINAGVKNLANRKFPFYDSAGGSFDPTRVDPRGRTFYLEVRNDFNF